MKEKEKEIEIPPEWEDEEDKIIKKKERFRLHRPRKKIRIRGLRWINRGIAVILFIFNFFISQISLATAPMAAKAMGLVFLGNAYILAHYLWKTRRVAD